MDEDPLKKWFAWQRRQHTEKVTGVTTGYEDSIKTLYQTNIYVLYIFYNKN